MYSSSHEPLGGRRDASADVVFDYDGALNAARRLWLFAEQLETVMGAREAASEDASDRFVGPFAIRFGERMGQERTEVNIAVTQLRTGATEWAAAWKNAMDEQNRVRYARAYEYSEDHQGAIGFLDGTERPPDAVPVAVPGPPSFAATGGFQNFGKMA